MATTQGDDCISPADRPEHAGLLEPGADHGLAAGFDDTRANKEVLFTKLGVAHTLGVSLKVVGLSANLFQNFGLSGFSGAQRENELFDFSLVE